MAVSMSKQENEQQGLLDASLMQNLQDRFCEANNVYLVCLSREKGVVTKAYGSRAELEYIHGLATMDMHASLMNKLLDHGIENVLEEDCGTDLVKLCGVSIRVSGKTAAIWIVIGIMEKPGDGVPPYVMRTTPERYYKSIGFLETLSKQMFAVKVEELLAQEAFLKSRESELQMETELQRNEMMTTIVKMLESEDDFEEIVSDILKDVCSYLRIAAGFLLRADETETTVEIVRAYASDEMFLPEPGMPQKMETVPFFNGRRYVISSNTILPEEFRQYFAQMQICAGIFLPIEAKEHTMMYLCFCEKEGARIWSAGDIKFVNDVKRIIQSILLKRIAKKSLATSYASLEAVLENVGCGICVRDPESGQTLYTNQRFQEPFSEGMTNAMLEPYRIENKKEDGTEYFREVYSEKEGQWFDLQRTPIRWVDGREVRLSTIYDVTDKKLYQQRIERQANNDFLTGLYNRMRCEQDLAHYIRDAVAGGGMGALLYIDLDDFKHINDGLGHQHGDVLLKKIADSLKCIPELGDNCYRMGGDEFIIILTQENSSLLQEVLERVRILFSSPWQLKEADYYCTMSMGVVQFPKDGSTVEELIQKVEIALYEAKRAGKNRIAFYDDHVESTSFKRLDLEKRMRDAAGNDCGEFEVVYQPIVDITKRGDPCVGAEALLRWNCRELGIISPAEFVPLAEYLGLINPIGAFVLREACCRCRYWNDMGRPEYKVNVNLSVVQLLQDDIVDTVRSVVEESGILPGNLTLEVTEGLAVNDMTRMKRVLANIRTLGVRVALDDFGTGYSSLNHIREMPLDVIKIDSCFVADIDKDEFQKAFVKMVAELARAIGVNVCVEGVETEEQLAALKKTKIQMIQGFYFGKPMNRAAFEKKYL